MKQFECHRDSKNHLRPFWFYVFYLFMGIDVFLEVEQFYMSKEPQCWNNILLKTQKDVKRNIIQKTVLTIGVCSISRGKTEPKPKLDCDSWSRYAKAPS